MNETAGKQEYIPFPYRLSFTPSYNLLITMTCCDFSAYYSLVLKISPLTLGKMASNGVGRVYPRGGRTPQFLTFGLLVVICILAFNYWNVSSRSKLLQKQVQEMTGTLEELAMKKVSLSMS